MSDNQPTEHVNVGNEGFEGTSTVQGDQTSETEEVSHAGPSAGPSASSSRARIQGTVKWFSVNKGFGFIQPNAGGDEVFVHQTSIRAEGFRSLREGEQVEYDLEVGDDGRGRAINVTGPQGAPPQGAPRRPVQSAPPYPPPMVPPQAPFGFYDPYGYPQMYPSRGGRFPGRFPPMGGRGGFGYGRGFGPAVERPPPPGTPGISSGYQVVVHNLPWSVTWQELKDVFSHTPGIVRADVILDSAGRSRILPLSALFIALTLLLNFEGAPQWHAYLIHVIVLFALITSARILPDKILDSYMLSYKQRNLDQ